MSVSAKNCSRRWCEKLEMLLTPSFTPVATVLPARWIPLAVALTPCATPLGAPLPGPQRFTRKPRRTLRAPWEGSQRVGTRTRCASPATMEAVLVTPSDRKEAPDNAPVATDDVKPCASTIQ
jgi:hypothetical protein